jgi:hypothetical protein
LKAKKTTPSYGHPSAGGELTPSLQDFSVVILHDNEAQMKPVSGAYVLVRERAWRNCNEISVRKNKLKIVKGGLPIYLFQLPYCTRAI